MEFLLLLPLLMVGGLFLGGDDSSGDEDASDPLRPDAGEVQSGSSVGEDLAGSSLSDLLLGLGGDEGASEPLRPDSGEVQSGSSVGEELAGSSFSDLLLGLGGPDTIEGLGGDDVVVGEFGFDRLTGDAGNDIVLGGGGNDLVDGAEGRDLLFGGAGDDTVTGGSGNDILIGSSGADTLRGGDGNDTMSGLEYDEIAADMQVTARILREDLRAIFGTDVTQGQLDRVAAAVTSGSAEERGADILDGGAGNDALLGDEGDTLTGGEGTDLFGINFSAGDAASTITDFDHLTERLVLVLDNPDTAAIEIRADGPDASQILVDGQIVVRLSGQVAADLTANQANWLRLGQA